MHKANSLQTSRWVALTLAAGLFATACGSSASVESEASDGREVLTNEAPSSSVEVEAETDDALESEPNIVPSPSNGEDPAETIEDPLFFGEYASLGAETVNLADYAGQDVVLWFWAPW